MNDYEKYLEQEANNANLKERLTAGESVFIHFDNQIMQAEVCKISDKSIKLKLSKGSEEIKSYPYFKIVKKGDLVALVWEAWRGVAGRGGYRWERTAYSNLRVPVENIPKNACVAEESFLVVNTYYQEDYLKKLQAPPKNTLKK